jgi:hypothetical protein
VSYETPAAFKQARVAFPLNNPCSHVLPASRSLGPLYGAGTGE